MVTFVGTLTHLPNLDAVHWLAQEIWPLVRERVPNAQLRIVGRATDDIRALPGLGAALDRADATVATNVPDILPWYWEAAVVVAPLRLGSGLRNKVLHAMATRAPVVATPAALEGIDAAPGRDVLVADTTAGIAERIAELLLDPQRAERLAASARHVAEQSRSDVVTERMDTWWRTSADRV